jgi:hypothetical protein
VGIIPAGTPEDQAFQQQEKIAVAGVTFEDGNIAIVGNGPYTVIVPPHVISNNKIPWTGSGAYDIYVVLNGRGGHYYKASSINFSSEITYIDFSGITEISP